MTIVDFLMQRIAEDEALARGAIQDGGKAGPWLVGADTAAHLDPNTVFRPSSWAGNIVHACSTYFTGDDQLDVARHIARHDPARVLAECTSKRQIIARHAVDDSLEWVNPVDGPAFREREFSCGICGWFPAGTACGTVQDLALPYAGHPDYRDEWRL